MAYVQKDANSPAVAAEHAKVDPATAPFKWTVEFEVCPTWVADGFQLTDEVAREMLAARLGYAYNWELGAKVLQSPDPERIKRCQEGEGEFADE